LLDNSHLDIEGGVRAAIDIVEAVRAAGRGLSALPSLENALSRPLAVDCLPSSGRIEGRAQTRVARLTARIDRSCRHTPARFRQFRLGGGCHRLRPLTLDARYALQPRCRIPHLENQWLRLLSSYHPTRDDFAAMLDESFAAQPAGKHRHQGKVVAIEKDMAVIDVGLKTEGRVALREFNGPSARTTSRSRYRRGVPRPDRDALGEPCCRATRRAARKLGKLEKAFQNNEKVNGVIFNQVKAASPSISTRRGFLPRSQVDIRPIRDVAPLMNNTQPFQILKMDRRRATSWCRAARCSRDPRRAAPGAGAEPRRGQVIDGVVKNITDYGAFVDLGGIDGLLHVTDIAWRRVNHPTEVLTIGQTVKVKIIKINHETHRISLGMKQLLDDPWQGIEAKYPVGARFTGRVTNITDYGAFVELEPGIEGLIHVSEMSWTKKNMHPGKIVSTSQEVEVQVLEVDSASAASRSPQADHAQSVGGVPGEAPGRLDRRGRGQEQDRVRPVPRPRGRRRRHGPSLRPRLEAARRAVIDNFKKATWSRPWCSTSMSSKERISLGVKQLEGDPFAEPGDVKRAPS